MKVSIEYNVKGSKKKYPDVAFVYPMHLNPKVYVPDDWSDEQIKEWYEERHHNICGIGVEVINIEKDNEVSDESK